MTLVIYDLNSDSLTLCLAVQMVLLQHATESKSQEKGCLSRACRRLGKSGSIPEARF